MTKGKKSKSNWLNRLAKRLGLSKPRTEPITSVTDILPRWMNSVHPARQSLSPPPEELERQEESLSRAATTIQRNGAFDWFVRERREGTMAALVENRVLTIEEARLALERRSRREFDPTLYARSKTGKTESQLQGKKADLIIEDEINEEDTEVKPKRNRVDLILAAARRKNEEEE